jgi:hypothetical protein
MLDLWPEQLEDDTMRSPVSVLQEQAALLGSKTKNLVQAEVEIGNTANDNFLYHFFIVAPTLNNYHYRLFSVEHGITLYPALIYLEEELGQEVGAQPLNQVPANYLEQLRLQQEQIWIKVGFLTQPETQYKLKVDTVEEFLKALSAILSSTVTKRVVAALLSQINVRTTSMISE